MESQVGDAANGFQLGARQRVGLVNDLQHHVDGALVHDLSLEVIYRAAVIVVSSRRNT